MEDEKTLNQAPMSDDSRKKPSAYELLMRQSRKMGGLAARTYDLTKEFLQQDVSTLHPDKILFGNSPQRSLPSSGDEEVGSVAAKTSEGLREQQERSAKTLDPRENLRKIVRKSHQLLASAQTVILPVNLFPDSVTVDRTKVTITKRAFFWTSSVISIRIEDVLNIACSTGPVFGSLIISSRVMNSTDHYEIDYFWRKDAIYLKQLIQGYVIAQHNQIETSHLKRDELIKTLIDLGNDTDY